MATTEAIRLDSGLDLEKDGRTQEHRRHQQFRNHANWATLALFWIIVACIAMGVVAYVYHLLTPECWHWLSQDALDKLQTLLGAAILSSALTQYVSKRME